jgi:hypothetical protein
MHSQTPATAGRFAGGGAGLHFPLIRQRRKRHKCDNRWQTHQYFSGNFSTSISKISMLHRHVVIDASDPIK